MTTTETTIRAYSVRLELRSGSARFTLQVAAVSPAEARALAEHLRPDWKAVACRRSPYAVTRWQRDDLAAYRNHAPKEET